MLRKKVNVILDLDNTLISAEPSENFPFDEMKEKMKKFKYYNMENYYIIFERPGLQDFLDFVFENFNVSIWTAATKDYALYIVDNIILQKKNRKLEYIFFSYHCEYSKKKFKSPKKLQMLWQDLNLPCFLPCNTFIIDDLSDVYKSQPDNCIQIREFNILEEESEHDVILKDIEGKLRLL